MGMGSLGEHVAQATHTSATASHNHQRWTPSARRCSRSSPRPTVSTPSSTTSRRRPRSRTGGPTRPTVTSGTMVRRSTVLRSSLTRPATSCRRPPSPWRRRRRCTERWRAMFPPSPVDHAHGGGGQEVRGEPGWHRHQARHHLQGGRQHPEEGEGRREHLHEQRGHPGGAGQEPQGLDQDGRRQRAEAGRAEKAVEREEKLKEKILSIQRKYKAAEDRFEYGEMSITKLNQKIDNIEDEICREKLKIKKVADELGDTFDDMLAHY